MTKVVRPLSSSSVDLSKPDYLGHRARMREKLLSKGVDSFSDAELLEMILMTALPRRDVKPLAKQLLRQFITLSGVIHADINVLQEIKGVKESVISLFKLIEGTCRILLKPDIKGKTVLAEWNQIIDYCRFNLSHKSQEYLYLIYLDKLMKLITVDDFQKGSHDKLPIFPQEILKCALNLNASSVIMVHNHPSGEARPSREDLVQTENVRAYLLNSGIQLYDHLIIADHKIYSFNNKSLIG